MATEDEPSRVIAETDDVAPEEEGERQPPDDGEGDADGSDDDAGSGDDEPGLDLDAFLTSIEGRLRGPFSSLELTKAIVTPSLRGPSTTTAAAGSQGPCSAAQYVRRLSRVLGRTDKGTQLRILMALLGVAQHTNGREANSQDDEDESERLDAAMARLLEQAQEAPTYDEWVRVVAGIVQDMMSGRASLEELALDTEARRVLDKTCNEIIQRVTDLIMQTDKYESDESDEEGDKDGVSSSTRDMTADADPTMAPLYYALLPPSLLEKIIPEAMSNKYFRVNEEAEILLMDAKLEQQKALDEQEHAAGTAAAASGVKTNTAVAGSRVSTNNGGSNETATNSSQTSGPAASAASAAPKRLQQPPPKKKSSMFLMPARPQARPTAALNRQPLAGSSVARAPPTALHARKAGAAQALLRSKAAGALRRVDGTGAAGAGTASLATAKPSISLAGGGDRHTHLQRSKLKMMDVTEVQDQFQKQQQQLAAMEGGMRGKKKRKADEVDEKEESTQKIQKTVAAAAATGANDAPSPMAATDAAAAAAAAALSAYQQAKTNASGAETDGDPTSKQRQQSSQKSLDLDPSHVHPRQQDWRQMLKERSNRLTPEDRSRIEQFFSNTSQDGQQSGVIKMKLHEDRLPDRKDTYYLELDYDNHTSKQSKKTKRYNDSSEQG